MKRPLIALAALLGLAAPAQAQEVWTRTNDATDHLGHPSTLYRQYGVSVDRQHPGSAELLVHCHDSSEDLGEVTEVAVIIHDSQEVESTVGDLMVKRIDNQTRTLPIFWLNAGDSHIMAVVHEGHGDSRNILDQLRIGDYMIVDATTVNGDVLEYQFGLRAFSAAGGDQNSVCTSIGSVAGHPLTPHQ